MTTKDILRGVEELKKQVIEIQPLCIQDWKYDFFVKEGVISKEDKGFKRVTTENLKTIAMQVDKDLTVNT